MIAREKLYKKENNTISKTINVEDKLYNQITKLLAKQYDCTTSDLINVAIEEYITKDSPTYYGKPENESVSYRNFRLRKENIEKLNEISKKTRISFTRLVNGAIKEFIESFEIVV